jgi:hypothetical protein
VSSTGQPSDRGAPRTFRSWRGPFQTLPGRATYEALWQLFAVSLLLVVGVQVAAYLASAVLDGWWPAYDTNAYWLAAKHILNGQPLYQQSTILGSGVYKYPPIFAQLASPIGLIPETYIDWAWRIVGTMCLRYLCGSWRLALIAALQEPVWVELSFGNVTLQLGAACLFALRDRRGAYLLPWFAALKFGPGLLIPYLWLTKPDYRRPLAVGCAVFAAACAVSFVVAQGLWADYVGTFGWEAASEMQAMNVLAIVPEHGGLDFAIRLAIAAAAVLAAIRWRADWLAFVAAVATMPILSVTRLAVLVGLWPLWLRGKAEAWRRNGGRVGEAATEAFVHLGMLSRVGAAAGQG